MGLINEFLSGAHRYFPNMVTVTLIVVGLLLGKINWVLVGIGAILVTIVVLTLQYSIGKALPTLGATTPGLEMIAACSMLPTAGGAYNTLPSVWIALSMFYLTYILKNAANIYTTKPTKLPAAAIPVQQRKGLGLISIVATALLMLTLLIPRFLSGCETSIIGVILGVALGISAGSLWWNILNACGADYYPDIHGVMIGIRPGKLHTSPVACTAASSA